MTCRASRPFGIVIAIYDDMGRHSTPHFHARCAEFESVFSIPDADVLAGHLPRKQRRLVQGGAALYADELE